MVAPRRGGRQADGFAVLGLDVVTRLGEHQRNLCPPVTPARAAVLALPPPVVLPLLWAPGAAIGRSEALAAWADLVGGGDGAAPVVDLSQDRRLLAVILRSLKEAGIQGLVLLGARDQPGLGRELACRWEGALWREGEGPWSWCTAAAAATATGTTAWARDLPRLLHDDPAPVVPLAEGVVRLRSGAEPPRGVQLALVGLGETEDPSLVVQDMERRGLEARAYALDPGRAAGSGSGLVPPAGLFGTAPGERIRARWLGYWRSLGHEAAFRDAVLGLEPDVEERLFTPAEARPHRARLFAVAGLDGAGKTTQAEALGAYLLTGASGASGPIGVSGANGANGAGRGLRCAVLKLYRQGAFLELADELGGRTRRGAPLAAFRVSRIIKLIDTLRVYRDALGPALAACDAVVVDRYVETHVAAAASQLGWDLRRHPLLGLLPPPDRTFWLMSSPAAALGRLRARGERLSADEHPIGLEGYARAFDQLVDPTRDRLLDTAAPQADNQELIARVALACLPGSSAAAVSDALSAGPLLWASEVTVPRVSPPAPVRVRRSTPARAIIGGPGGGQGGEKDGGHDGENDGGEGTAVVLAEELLELAALLRQELGQEPGDAVPRGLWAEAYAAQLVLDVRTSQAERVTVPLWPTALGRTAGFADPPMLAMLAELERLLVPLVTIDAWYPAHPDDHAGRMLRLFARGDVAQRRLLDAYNRALAEEAAARGWPRAP